MLKKKKQLINLYILWLFILYVKEFRLRLERVRCKCKYKYESIIIYYHHKKSYSCHNFSVLCDISTPGPRDALNESLIKSTLPTAVNNINVWTKVMDLTSSDMYMVRRLRSWIVYARQNIILYTVENK